MGLQAANQLRASLISGTARALASATRRDPPPHKHSLFPRQPVVAILDGLIAAGLEVISLQAPVGPDRKAK